MDTRRMTRQEFLRLSGMALAAAAGPVLGGGRAGAQAGELVVVDWGGAAQAAKRKAFFEPFEKETGLKVKATAPPDLGKLKAMVATGNPEWDAMTIMPDWVIRSAKQGLLEPLDYTKIDKSVVVPEATHSHGIGLHYWSTVKAYNKEKWPAGDHPKTWKDFWDVKRFPGGRALWNYPHGNLEFALMADGVPPDKLYPLDVDRAFRKLNEIKPHITKWYDSGAQQVQLLVDKQVDLASAWSARIITVQRQGAKLGLEWTEALLDMDMWAVVKGSRHKDAAMRLIASSLDAKKQGTYADAFPYGPVIPKALEFISPASARELPSHPENLKLQTMRNFAWWAENEEKILERWKVWILAR